MSVALYWRRQAMLRLTPGSRSRRYPASSADRLPPSALGILITHPHSTGPSMQTMMMQSMSVRPTTALFAATRAFLPNTKRAHCEELSTPPPACGPDQVRWAGGDLERNPSRLDASGTLTIIGPPQLQWTSLTPPLKPIHPLATIDLSVLTLSRRRALGS